MQDQDNLPPHVAAMVLKVAAEAYSCGVRDGIQRLVAAATPRRETKTRAYLQTGVSAASLAHIRAASGAVHVKDIAAALGVPRNAVDGATHNLMRRGLVVRVAPSTFMAAGVQDNAA